MVEWITFRVGVNELQLGVAFVQHVKKLPIFSGLAKAVLKYLCAISKFWCLGNFVTRKLNLVKVELNVKNRS